MGIQAPGDMERMQMLCYIAMLIFVSVMVVVINLLIVLFGGASFAYRK